MVTSFLCATGCVIICHCPSIMDNCTLVETHCNTTTPHTELSLKTTFFAGYVLFMLVLLIAVGGLVLLTAVAVGLASPVPKIIRVFLVNLLAAGLVVASICFVIGCVSIILVLSDVGKPTRIICALQLWVFGTGAVARLLSVAAFSIVVLRIVWFGKTTMKGAYIALTLALLWITAMLLNIHIVLPVVFAVQFVDGVACFPHYGEIHEAPRYIFTGSWIVFGGLTPLTISTVVPSVCLCYIKRHSITEGVGYKRAMAKFALFLVAGNLINLLGQTVPGIIAYFADAAGVYAAYTLSVVSLLPTPILVIIFLKPVRKKLLEVLTFNCAFVKKRRLAVGLPPSLSHELE